LATAALILDWKCESIWKVDMAKEHPNVVDGKILGCKVVPFPWLKTLKEAVDSA